MRNQYMTGEGRFNWTHFCEETEKARAASWKDAARVRSARAFADIDRDGSGKISRDEIEAFLKRSKVKPPAWGMCMDMDRTRTAPWTMYRGVLHASPRPKVPADKATLDKLIANLDKDGDGNIDFPEFVDGFVKRATPSSLATHRTPCTLHTVHC